MKNKLASLTAAFTLAVAGLAAPAQAQTIPVNAPVYSTGQTVVYTPAATSYVSQRDIDDIAYTLGVRSVYPMTGKGFTSGIINRTGQHIGLEFNLNGSGYATVVRAYNLDNPAISAQYGAALNNAAQTEAMLMSRYNQPRTVYVQPQYRPNAVDVIAAVGLVYIAHEVIKDNRRDNRRYAPPPRHHNPRHAPPPRHHYPRR